MKNTFGNSIAVTIFGESHGEAIGAVVDGLGAGIKLDTDYINERLDLRKPKGKISTQRKEGDSFEIVSGLFNGRTTGTPLTLIIKNTSQHSKDYEATKYLCRPSHADFTAFEKYSGYQDYRGGGHFSGRITAPLVAVGAIAQQILREKGIKIATHISSLHGIKDEQFSQNEDELLSQQEALNKKYFPVISDNIEQEMIAHIEECAKRGDSVGGVLQTVVTGVEAGIGEPFFGSVESVLSSLLYSVPAVKGVSFGAGFELENMYGSQANDSFYNDKGTIKTRTNNNGGINGGITNGMPIIINTCIKPTPSIFIEQETVDYSTGENVKLQIKGRHDPAIIHRARVVADSVVAIGILDLYCERYGSKFTEV